MAKKKVAQPAPAEQAPKDERLRDPLSHDSVILALSKAHAARWLLDAMEYDALEVRWQIGGMPERPREHEELRSWLAQMALETLRESLDEAETAYRESTVAAKTEAAA